MLFLCKSVNFNTFLPICLWAPKDKFDQNQSDNEKILSKRQVWYTRLVHVHVLVFLSCIYVIMDNSQDHSRFLTHYHTILHFDALKPYSCGKHREKGEIACNKQLLFSRCFLPYMTLIKPI